MATSSVPILKAALLAAIKARDGLYGIQVEWAHPGGDIAPESIFMGDAQFSDEHVAGMRTAPHAHSEAYVVPVYVDVLSAGNDAQAAEERAWVLAGEVEDALRVDPSLSDAAGLLWAVVTGKEPVGYLSDQGRACRCVLAVNCRARI